MSIRNPLRLLLVLLAVALGALTDGPSAQIQPPSGGFGGPNASPNVDVRTGATDADRATLAQLVPPGVAAGDAATARDAGLARLRAEVPDVAMDPHPSLGIAEIVGTATATTFLTPPSDDRVATLRGFLTAHADLYGLPAGAAAELTLVADYVNPAGNLAWVEFEQSFNGIPVFQGTLRGGFTPRGELVRTTGLLAAGIADANALAVAPGTSAARAVAMAAASVGWPASESALAAHAVAGERGRTSFAGAMTQDAAAWLVYFPVAPGVARLAWATEIIGDPDAYLTLVDTDTGLLLFRKNLTNYQTQPVTYNVYTSDSPAPASPTPALPGSNYQAPLVPRSNQTLIGNEGASSFNTLGWMNDGTNVTDGNNVEAGMDLVAPDGVDAPVTGSGFRVFDFVYTPATGNPGTGDAPTLAAYRNGEAVNMFYWTNRFHDATYQLGFTEQARNFQHDNFGRGGAAGDRVRAEGQDYAGTNNANFMTPVDGQRGRMQMYVFTGPNPDRSSGLDQDVILHELAHGLSNRLHANASGLTFDVARGMGEGWSDFYARALLSTADEPLNGVYAAGGWLTLHLDGSFSNNYYYGIRRFPYALRSVTGGPMNRPHNPLTFADIDPAQINMTDGAYPRSTIPSSSAIAVHNMGEIWASALFEVRARFISRLGFAAGNQRILQLVTDGMKLDPVNPTMLQGRDSIIAAAAGNAVDIADIWAGFAVRGMGAGAQHLASPGCCTVVESFAVPDPLAAFPPTGLVVQHVVGSQVTLRWTPPTVGAAPTTYVLEGGVSPGQVMASVPTGSNAPVFRFNAPSGAFYVRMHTIAGARRSAASNEVRIFVNTATVPSAPTGLLGQVQGNTLALSWRNTFTGGTPTGNILQATGPVNVTLPLGLTETFSFAGVPPGTYRFRVRSVGVGGMSGLSNEVLLTFPTGCTGVPNAPADVVAYRVGNVISVLWDPPATGAAATGYVLNVTGAFTGAFPLPGRSISAAVPPGTYNLSVRATNGCGAGASTPTRSVTIP